MNPSLRREIALLKQLTWFYVIEAPSLAIKQHAQKQVVRYLFGVFAQETRKYPSKLLPPYYRERLRDALNEKANGSVIRRIVVDLVSGMTETQALALYQRLNGIVTGYTLERILL